MILFCQLTEQQGAGKRQIRECLQASERVQEKCQAWCLIKAPARRKGKVWKAAARAAALCRTEAETQVAEIKMWASLWHWAGRTGSGMRTSEGRCVLDVLEIKPEKSDWDGSDVCRGEIVEMFWSLNWEAAALEGEQRGWKLVGECEEDAEGRVEKTSSLTLTNHWPRPDVWDWRHGTTFKKLNYE